MIEVKTICSLRAILSDWRRAGETIGFVPTMGALHEGHMALLGAAKKMSDRSVVSVFVNPTQFDRKDDFEKYTHQLAADSAYLEERGCDLLFAPRVDDIYPEGFSAKIDPGPLATVLEGASRPGHFSGVATVVCKLFNLVQPSFAFFGEKDYQQLLVVKRLVRDLDIPVEIVPVETMRSADGVALSSRNNRLTPDERKAAGSIPVVLFEVKKAILDEIPVHHALLLGRRTLQSKNLNVDYLTLRDAKTLEAVNGNAFTRPARLLVAVYTPETGTRLIDNCAVAPAPTPAP